MNWGWLGRRALFRSVYKGPRVKGYWWLRRMALQSPANKWARKVKRNAK